MNKKKMDERIVLLLKRKREGISLQKFVKELGLSPKERPQIRRRLKSLEGRGIIQKVGRRYYILKKSDVVRGLFISSSGGFGFVRPEEGSQEDIFIPARFTGEAVQGDVVDVLCRERAKRDKPEGRVVRIVKRGKERIVGLYSEQYGQPFFLPFDTPYRTAIPVASKKSYSPQPGMVVEIDRRSLHLTGIYGMPDEPGVDTRVVIQRHNLLSAFSEETVKEAECFSAEILPKDIEGRVDYREWNSVTIDGESAQDFDDAVSVKKLEGGNYLLGVHIADVSYYVQPGTCLDKEAFQKGTSVYFPDLTLPMLPLKLSEEICSLQPKKERLTFSVLMEIDEKGEVRKSEFHPSLIRTAERMTYNSVYKIFQRDEEERKKYRPLVPDLLLMRELARLLRRKREEEGSLDFDLLEPELVYREGELYSVEPFEPNEAHHVIEEFMVAANEAVASYLSQKKISFIYRVHPRPALRSLARLRTLLTHFKISLPDPEKVKSEDLQQAIKSAEGKPEEKFITLQILKSLKLAVYSDENQGHYGLAKKEYTHFTSPIRRYPDLVVHRLLKQVIRGEKAQIPSLSSVALHCSHRERDAEAAERDLVEWRIFRYLQEKLGNEFEGIIVGISKAGLGVELDNYFVDGLIPYEDLKDDYYFKKSEKTLIGRRTGRKFELGNRVEVILASVNPLRRRMDLTLTNRKAKRAS